MREGHQLETTSPTGLPATHRRLASLVDQVLERVELVSLEQGEDEFQDHISVASGSLVQLFGCLGLLQWHGHRRVLQLHHWIVPGFTSFFDLVPVKGGGGGRGSIMIILMAKLTVLVSCTQHCLLAVDQFSE